MKIYCINQSIQSINHCLEKNYVVTLLNKEVINEIRSDIGKNAIWVRSDETIDSCGHNIAHVICEKVNIKYFYSLLIIPKKFSTVLLQDSLTIL